MTLTSDSGNLDLDLDALLNRFFTGKVVRKDLTKRLKEGINVPVYVLEYLLGMYCASDNEEVIADGLETVKRILAENYVRPDEAEKVKSKIRERGSFKIIDKVSVSLNERRDIYQALFMNLGVKDAEIPSRFIKDFEKLLAGGIWCIVTMNYHFEVVKARLSLCMTSSPSRCLTWTWTRCWRRARRSVKPSGLMCCCAQRAWSQLISMSARSGICSLG